MVNFTDFLHRREPVRYHMDVLKEGEIAGYCTLHGDRLKDELGHLSPLQSWAPELRFFTELPQRPIESGMCDVIVTQPTVFLKLDASKSKSYANKSYAILERISSICNT